MLHRVSKINASRLSSNENMKIAPETLDLLIESLKDKYVFIRSENILDYVLEKHDKPFAVFTLDDAYLDNLTEALPIFEKNKVPFTIFAATDYISHSGFLWWFQLENVILQNESLLLSDGSYYSCNEKQQKEDTFLELRNRILNMNPLTYEEELNLLFLPYKNQWKESFSNLIMNWQDLLEISNHELVTIGAHTKHHYNLKALPSTYDVQKDIEEGVAELSEHGIRCSVFAYPYGSKNEVSDREIEIASNLGFKEAFISYGDLVTSKNIHNPYAIHRIMMDNHTKIKDLIG